MFLLLKIAARNVFRNKRRTLITELAIIFGAITIILVGGILQVTLNGLREQTIRTQLGHFQVHAKGYSTKGVSNPWKYVIKEPDTIKKIIKNIHGVKSVSEQVEFSGIVSNGDNSTNFIATGIVPRQGGLFSGLNIIKGRGTDGLTPDGALVGKELAEGLGVKVGDELTLLTNTVHGSFNAVQVVVEGIFQSGSTEYDKRSLITSLDTARTLIDLKGVTSLIVMLNRTRDTDRVKQALLGAITETKAPVEFTTWRQLATYYNQVRGMFNGIFGSIKFIISIVIILGIANTMIMSVLERTSEIGTIMSLGSSRGQVIVLFLLEALIIGIIGGITGVFLGVLITKVVAIIGIPVPPPPGNSTGFVIRPLLLGTSMLFALMLSVLSALFSGLYPAYKASKLKPVDALRHI